MNYKHTIGKQYLTNILELLKKYKGYLFGGVVRCIIENNYFFSENNNNFIMLNEHDEINCNDIDLYFDNLDNKNKFIKELTNDENYGLLDEENYKSLNYGSLDDVNYESLNYGSLDDVNYESLNYGSLNDENYESLNYGSLNDENYESLNYGSLNDENYESLNYGSLNYGSSNDNILFEKNTFKMTNNNSMIKVDAIYKYKKTTVNDFSFNLIFIDGNGQFIVFDTKFKVNDVIDQIKYKYGYMMPFSYQSINDENSQYHSLFKNRKNRFELEGYTITKMEPGYFNCNIF